MSQILPDSKTYVIITTRSLEIEKQDCILLEKKKKFIIIYGCFLHKDISRGIQSCTRSSYIASTSGSL